MNARDFWRLYREVYRRRWLVIAVCASTLTVVALGCILMPRYYRASAFVMPSEAALTKPLIPGLDHQQQAARGPDPRRKDELMGTFIGLARTSEVRHNAIRSLGLRMTPAQLEDLVKVEPAAGSIIRITCLSRTSDGAVALANAIAHEFARYYQEIASQQAKRNREFLEGEVAAAAADLERAKAELQAFKSAQGEAALPVGTAENPFLRQFYALRAETDAARSRLREVEGRIRAVRAELREQPPARETETATTDNPVTLELQSRLAQLERDLLLARARYTDRHRTVRDLETQIEDVRERLAREADRMITRRTVEPNPTYHRLQEQLVDLEAERTALAARLNSLAGAMADNERRAAQLADASVALMSQTRDYANAETRHARLLAMLEDARVEEKVSASAGEIQIVDQAKSAVGPVTKKGPSVIQLLLLGVILSLGLGLGGALALAFIDDKLRAGEDLHRELELPVPAVIPELTAEADGVPLARITELRPLSPHAEAFRFLRTELVHQNGASPVRTLMIATARPGQGGSTTAVNLATALAEVGHRVVLVDADMRRPGLHAFFDEPNNAGLTTLLANGSEGAAKALRRTSLENLLLLPAGPPVDNPAALLSSGRMRTLLDRLKQNSDYVIIDTPSAAAFADAALLGPLVDGVILVVRASQPVREAELRTKRLFQKVGANVIGAVLNQAPADAVDSYYFHRHYYPTTRALPPGSPPGAGSAAEPMPAEVPARPNPPAEDRAAAPGEPAAPQQAVEEMPSAPGRAIRPGRLRRGVLVLLGVAALALAAAALVASGRLAVHPPAAPAAVAPAPAAPGLRVIAVIRQPVELRVETDGRLLYEGVLTGGQQIWQASEEITLWANRPAAIEVTVNGRSLGPLGEPGDPPAMRRFTAAEEQSP